MTENLHAHIPNESGRVNVASDVECSRAKLLNVVLELERPRICQLGLHLVDELGVTPEDVRAGVIVLA